MRDPNYSELYDVLLLRDSKINDLEGELYQCKEILKVLYTCAIPNSVKVSIFEILSKDKSLHPPDNGIEMNHGIIDEL